MKKIIFALAIGVGFITFNQASAQDEVGKFSPVVKLGYFSPSDSDLKDLFGSGLAFSVGGKYLLSSQLAIVGALDYWKGTDKKTEEGVDLDISCRIMPITVSLLYTIPVQGEGKFVPYIGGGLGNYSTKSEVKGSGGGISVIVENTKSAIGTHIMGGFNYPVSPKVAINGEMKYAMATIDDTEENLEAGGLTIGGGVAISF